MGWGLACGSGWYRPIETCILLKPPSLFKRAPTPALMGANLAIAGRQFVGAFRLTHVQDADQS